MRVSGSEQQLCSCYKEYQDFQKLVELKDSSLVVYYHRTRTEDVHQQRWQGEVVEQAETTPTDVFILHNKKDARITISQLTSELEKKNISCPRCRKIFEHAQELMQEVKSIERNIVIGICDYCRKKAQTIKNQFCVCDEIVRKFKSGKREQKENTKKHVKTWLSKMEHILKDVIMLNKPKPIKHRAYSDLQINRDLKSSTSRDEPAIQQMICLGTHKSDINLNRETRETVLKEDYFKPGVTFSQPLISIKPVATSFADTLHERENINTMISRTSLLKTYEDVKELPKTSLKDRRKEEVFEDTPSMDAKDALKRRHDLSLRQMMRLEKDSVVPLKVLKKPMVYEIPKIAPWEQKGPTPKYHEDSEIDIKIKTKHDLRPRGTHDQRKTDKYSDNKKGNKSKIDPQVSKPKSWYKKAPKPKETGLKPQFSFYFPKMSEKIEQVQLDVSSLHLIKYTQEKFRRQAVKKRQEEERLQEFDYNQNKISREEKKRQVEEKKRQVEEKKEQAVEDQMKYEEEREILYEHKKYSKKDLKSSSGDKDEQQNKAKRDKFIKDTFEKDEEIFEKSQLKGKISKESGIVKQDSKSDPEREHKIDELHKAKKVLKSTPEQRGKIDDDLISNAMKIDKVKVSEKAKKDLKVMSELKDKAGEKEQTIKTKEEKRDVKIQNEKETLKKNSAKERELLIKDIDAPSKHGKSNKIKRDSPSEIKVSLSKILKKNKKELSTNEKKMIEIKQVKEIKMKTEGGDEKKRKEKEEKKSLMQMEQLRQEGESLKKHAEKEHLVKSKDAPSKTGKSTKIKQVSLGKINVSLTKILKGTKKEISANENEMIEIKQVKEIKMKSDFILMIDEKNRKEKEEKEKQIEQIQNEREALKKQSEKEQLLEHKDAPSKTEKSTKIKQVSPGDIKVSLTTIFKKIIEEKKETSANKKEVHEIKQKVLEKEDIKEKKEYNEKVSKQNSEFIKLQAERLKERLEKKKQLEYEAKEKERKIKEQAELRAKPVDIKINDIKVDHFSKSEYILNLVRLKQAASMKPSDIKPAVIVEHKCHHGINIRSFCPLCYNSELEIEVISLENKKPSDSIKDIIIGEKIFKIKQLLEKSREPEVVLNLYQNFFFDPPNELIPQEEPAQTKTKPLKNKLAEQVELQEPGKGVLRYALSDRTFIEKGWTVLPTEKVVRKMNIYRMRPAHPEFDWFEHNKNKRLMTYDTGEKLAEFDDNGRGRWYYRSGRLALDYYDAEETNAQQRFVIYSSGEPDERGRTHPITILATFDYLGNGIVFDHAGKIRLKYNQTEGVVLDRSIGPVSHWKWHTLNDPPVLQQVMIDTQLPQKDPDILKLGPPVEKTIRPENEEMIAIEFDNFIKEKSKKLSQKFKPFQIKMKALKINEHFSLKVLDQATIYLIFRDGSTNLKLNIGMLLDHKEIVDTETAELGEVSNSLEQFPARTDSLAGLQRSVAHAQRYERQHAERERRLRPAEPCASGDLLSAAVSPPLRVPLRTMPTESTSSTGYCSRKPTNNLYYNSRLL